MDGFALLSVARQSVGWRNCVFCCRAWAFVCPCEYLALRVNVFIFTFFHSFHLVRLPAVRCDAWRAAPRTITNCAQKGQVFSAFITQWLMGYIAVLRAFENTKSLAHFSTHELHSFCTETTNDSRVFSPAHTHNTMQIVSLFESKFYVLYTQTYISHLFWFIPEAIAAALVYLKWAEYTSQGVHLIF